MVMKTIHCRLCGFAIKGKDFASRMAKLRSHRKRRHPTAHRRSVIKALKTRLSINPKGEKMKMARRIRRWRPRKWSPTIRRRARGFITGLGKGLSLKSIAAGSLGLMAMQRFQPFGGVYKPAVDKIVLGIILPMIKLDNQDMLTVGIKEGIATLANQYLGAGAGIGQVQGGML